jgi:hypothetical protein
VISINSSSYTLYEELKSDMPEGVAIELQPIRMGFKDAAPSPDNVTTALNIDIKITIDLTKITAIAVAAWLAKKYSSALSKEHDLKARINNKEIPYDNDDYRTLINHEVNNKLQK